MRLPDAEVDERRSEAMRLRAQGLSYRAIGRAMDVSHETAREMCDLDVRLARNAARREHYRQSPEVQEQTKQRLQARRDAMRVAV